MTLHLGGRLWQQWLMPLQPLNNTGWTGLKDIKMSYVLTCISPSVIQLEKVIWILQALEKNVILPANFTGSQRYMNYYFKDSLVICRTIGHPSLFLTMKCNTQWPKIQAMLEYLLDVDVVNAPDIIAHVFKLKLNQLIDLIKNKSYFGRCIGSNTSLLLISIYNRLNTYHGNYSFTFLFSQLCMSSSAKSADFFTLTC